MITRGSREFTIERLPPSSEIDDFDGTLSLLVSSYCSSVTNNYTLDYDPRISTPSLLRKRINDLTWLYSKVLRLYGTMKPEYYRIKFNDKQVSMIIIRKYDHNKKIVEQGAVNRGGLKDQLYIGLALVPFKLGFNAFSKILSHGEAGDYVHKLFSQSSGIHKRLDFVCTHPEFQGLGLCSELMNRVIEDADKEKFTLYLSSSDVKNQEYYRRFGFNWVGECEGEAGFVTTGMVRKPNGDNKGAATVGKVKLKKREGDGINWTVSILVITLLIILANFQ